MNYSDIGRQFGLNEQQTQAAFEALSPVIAAGMRRNASTGGLSEIIEAMQRGGGGGASATDFGNVVLGEVFGSKDVSRGVAQQLSAQSGIGAAVLKQLLPIVASIVMGQVAKKALGGGGGGGGLADILGGILGGGARPAPRQANPGGGGLGDILGEILGGGAGRQAQQAPRGQTGPSLEDILGDIMGGTGGGGTRQQAPQQMPGGFEDILKDIFGGGMGGGASQGDGGIPQPRMQQRRSVDAADDLLNSVEQAVRRR
jgi:hypothetical protein